jgi:hypothetical protein
MMQPSVEEQPDDATLAPLKPALARLMADSAPSDGRALWKPSTIKHLWQSFHEAMPGLHFLPKKQVFTSPTPLLLAAMLYCSSSRGSAEVAAHAPAYHRVLAVEISKLSLPQSYLPGDARADQRFDEEWAFQTILGIILAALLSEARCNVTGLWISIAYKVLLEHCPPQLGENSRQWQQIFAGLQILDLEHASIHLSCPSIPLEPPLNSIHMSSADQLYRLSRMMHVGLTHFAGRGLPTIWSYFSDEPTTITGVDYTFSGVDAAVIRDWARQLDDWLKHFSTGPFESESERKLVYRQYVMHRLCVLSIYLPFRRYDLFSMDATPKERYELLLSARATIRLWSNDPGIWSNWDFIMITWAALIVLQGVKGGFGEAGDLQAIGVHLDLLKATKEPTPNLRHTLAARLQREMYDAQEVVQPEQPAAMDWSDPLGYPWSLFDEASLQSVNLYWPDVGAEQSSQSQSLSVSSSTPSNALEMRR